MREPIIAKTSKLMLALLVLLASTFCASNLYAQSGRIVLQKGNAKIYQQDATWQMWHGNEVVAHGDGILNVNNLPPGFISLWEAIAKTSTDTRLTKISKATSTTYGPLLRTKWDQPSPYNDVFPLLYTKESDGSTSEERCVVGCGTVASAQVLNFYKTCGPINVSGTEKTTHDIKAGSNYYTISNVKQQNNTYSYDYRMSYTPDFDKINSDNLELSKFMMAVSLAQHASYGTVKDDGGTGTNPSDIADAMKNIYGYDVLFYNNIDKINTDLRIANALQKGHPVILWGGNHLYIADGYNGNEYHIDWGWGGSSNAWYTTEAFTATEFSSYLGAIIAVPRNGIEMQATPKYLHVISNGTDKKYNVTLQDGIRYTTQVKLAAGSYDFYYEYADGKKIAPYTNNIVTIDGNNNTFSNHGKFIDVPATFTIANGYTMEFTHNAGSNEIKIEATDSKITIAGKVLDKDQKPVAGATITTSPNRPTETTKEASNSKGSGYLLYTTITSKLDVEGEYITKIAFKTFYYGNPGDIIVSILENGQTVWEQTVPQSQVKNSSWTTTNIDKVIRVTPSKLYYIRLTPAKEYTSSDRYYYYYVNDYTEIAYQVTTSDSPYLTTGSNGSYELKLENPFNGKLYAFAEGNEFAPLSFNNVSANLTGQNFKPGSASQYISISGKVLDENSQPLPYAIVSTAADKPADKSVTADAYGNYYIDVDKNFSGKLYAFADGYQIDPVSLSNVTSNVTGKNFKGVSKQITLSGSIIDENNNGIAGAIVSLTNDKNSSNAVKTAANGSFSIKADKNFTGKIYTFADDCDFESYSITNASSNKSGIVIKEMPKYVTISGKVLDANSKPVANAWITDNSTKPESIISQQNNPSTLCYYLCRPQNIQFTPTNNYITQIGVYIYCNGAPGKLIFSIVDDMAQTIWTKTFTHEEWTTKWNSETTVEVGVPVTAGKKYSLSATWENGVCGASEYYAYMANEDKSIAYKIYSCPALGITNANGEYSISVRRHSNTKLYAFTNNMEYAPLSFTDVATDLTNKNFAPEVTSFTISGKVTDENSTAISGATVTLTSSNNSKMTAKTNSKGSYTFTVEKGFSGTLSVAASGYNFSTIAVSNVTKNVTGKNFQGEKIIIYYTISGIVTNEKDKAISGAEITLTSTNKGGQTTKTDRNGNYSFTVEKGLSGTITASADGYSFTAISVSKVAQNLTNKNFKGEKIIVSATITGKVTDENNVGIYNAEVSTSLDKTDAVRTDAKGTYTIQVDDNFSGKLYAFTNGYTFDPISIRNASGIVSDKNFKGKSIVSNTSVYIMGKVYDKEYNPVSGAEVYTTTDGVAELKADVEKSDNSTNCYYVDTKDFKSNYTYSEFKPNCNKIGRVEFKAFYGGNPGKLTVAIISNSKAILWQKSISKSSVKNNDWTAVTLDSPLTVTPGSTYYIVLKAEKANTGANYYAYYDSEADDGMQYKISALVGGETKQSVYTSFDGSYTYEVPVGKSVTLYANYGNFKYKPLTFSNPKLSASEQDFVPEGAVASDFVTISGKVYNQISKPIAGAWITPSSKTPQICSSQEKCENCYSFTKETISFTADSKYLTQVDFMISKAGTPGNLKVSILNASQTELWSKTFTNDETTAWQWKEVPLDQIIELVPGEIYNLCLTATNKSGSYYYYVMDNENWDMAHRVWTSDEPCTRSAEDGSYSFQVKRNSTGSLHAYYEDLTFNTQNYSKLTKDANGYDFRIFMGMGELTEKVSKTPVSEIINTKTTTDNIYAWTFEKKIFIEEAAGLNYTIIDVNGKILKEGIVHNSLETITLDNNTDKVIIVKVGVRSFKLFY